MHRNFTCFRMSLELPIGSVPGRGRKQADEPVADIASVSQPQPFFLSPSPPDLHVIPHAALSRRACSCPTVILDSSGTARRCENRRLGKASKNSGICFHIKSFWRNSIELNSRLGFRPFISLLLRIQRSWTHDRAVEGLRPALYVSPMKDRSKSGF